MKSKEYTKMIEEIDASELRLYGWDLQFISNLIDNPVRHYTTDQIKQIECDYKNLLCLLKNYKSEM